MLEPHAHGVARGQEGQAAVESAIVLPLYVFLILGILQLGLMHQARLLTKYAAYKAARAGALHHASTNKMERAALAVLLPMVSRDTGGGEHIMAVHQAQDFSAKWRWPEVHDNRMREADLPYVSVTICGPTRQEFPSNLREVPFDAPAYTAHQDWQQGQRTKLRVQVTFNYRMPIPFANQVIWFVARNREVPLVLRMGEAKGAQRPLKDARGGDTYSRLADHGVYVQPIRATYTMRMQSNFLPRKAGHALPEKNSCVFPFGYPKG